jgi:hypothetical protein
MPLPRVPAIGHPAERARKASVQRHPGQARRSKRGRACAPCVAGLAPGPDVPDSWQPRPCNPTKADTMHAAARAATPLLLLLPLLALPACAPAAPAAAGAAPWPVLPPRAEALPGVMEDLGRMEGRDNHERFEALADMLRQRGTPFEVHTFENTRPERASTPVGRNIVITIGEGARDIVVGAHYDAVRLADGSLSPGITDNAAGAVMLVRAAETLRALPRGPHRLRVVFFDLEEIGLLGSAAYIRDHGANRSAAMINVDVAGFGSTIMKGPSSHPGNEAVYAAAALVCALQRFDCLAFPSYPSSDDRSFQRAGVPNISLGVLPPIEARQFWLALNAGPASGLAPDFTPRIMRILHSADDTLDKVEPAALALAHDMVVSLVRVLDR